MLSAAEWAGWVLAAAVIAVMGFVVAHGPFNLVSKPTIAPHYAAVTVIWTFDAKSKLLWPNLPDPVHVHVGQPIIWLNKSNAPHTAYTRDNPQTLNSQNVAIGQSFRFVPTKVGTFQYFCQYHPSMRGVLIVGP
jgi:plastocyanin